MACVLARLEFHEVVHSAGRRTAIWARGCDAFEQHVLTFDTASAVRMNAGDDEVLYVLSGAGCSIAGEATAFEVGDHGMRPSRHPLENRARDKLEILSVLIRNVPPDRRPR